MQTTLDELPSHAQDENHAAETRNKCKWATMKKVIFDDIVHKTVNHCMIY